MEAVTFLQQTEGYFDLSASEGIETVHCRVDDGKTLLNVYYQSGK